MAFDSQLGKGVLEGCILKLLEGCFRYSGEIVTLMRECGFADFSEGTLYPMLLRLEKAGCFVTEKRATSNSPPKKYYKLSATGLERLKTFENMWNELVGSVEKVFKREN